MYCCWRVLSRFSSSPINKGVKLHLQQNTVEPSVAASFFSPLKSHNRHFFSTPNRIPPATTATSCNTFSGQFHSIKGITTTGMGNKSSRQSSNSSGPSKQQEKEPTTADNTTTANTTDPSSSLQSPVLQLV